MEKDAPRRTVWLSHPLSEATPLYGGGGGGIEIRPDKSISSLAHRETGREAHRLLLGKGCLLFEDMTLETLADNETLQKVTALPLRIEASDGVPCTIIGLFTHES